MVIELDVGFSDVIRKTAAKSSNGKYCYVYLPADWDGAQVAILRLTKGILKPAEGGVIHKETEEQVEGEDVKVLRKFGL